MIQRSREERFHADLSARPQDCSSSQQRAFDNIHVFPRLWIERSTGLSESTPFKLKTNCSLALNTYLGQSLFLAASTYFSDYFLLLLVLQTSPHGLSPRRADVQSSTGRSHPPCAGHLFPVILHILFAHFSYPLPFPLTGRYTKLTRHPSLAQPCSHRFGTEPSPHTAHTPSTRL